MPAFTSWSVLHLWAIIIPLDDYHIDILFFLTDIAKCSMVPRTPPPSNVSWFLDGHNSDKNRQVQPIQAASMA